MYQLGLAQRHRISIHSLICARRGISHFIDGPQYPLPNRIPVQVALIEHGIRDSIATESVDLIYLDPPFNSNATYNVGC